MNVETTRPEKIVGLTQNGGRPSWQLEDEAWSFGPEDRLLFASRPAQTDVDLDRGPIRNVDSESTETPPKLPRPSRAPHLRRNNFGRRSATALSHWEGVVEAIGEHGFDARLIPYEDGVPLRTRVELASFDFDELVDESDVKLVKPGAVFYWTIARSRNAAGTVANASIVRFKRSPAPAKSRRDAAEREARRIMDLFKSDD